MATVEQLLEEYESGAMTFDQLLDGVSKIDVQLKAPATSQEQIYARAEEMPGPNDSFWLDSAIRQGTITGEQYQLLYAAIQ